VLAAWISVPGIFLMIAALALVMIVLLWWLVPTPVVSRSAAQPRGDLRQALTDPHLQRLYFSIMALHMLMTGTFVVLPPLLRDELHLPPAHHLWLYLPTVVLSIVAMVPLIVHAERRARLKQVFVAMVALLGCGLLIIEAGSHALLAVAAGLLAFLIAFNVLEATLPSMMSRLAPMAGRGAAMGVYSTAQFLGAFMGGAGAGWLRGHHGTQGVLLSGLALCVVWLAVSAGLRAPAHLQTRLVDVGSIGPERARSLTGELMALAGVAEAVVIPDEGVAYLRVDGQRFDPGSLQRIVGVGG
jgi:predicted MFS family arabinose efflux permease